MNKLITKIASLCVGLMMTVGVGVALGTGDVDLSAAHAASETSTLTIKATTGTLIGESISWSNGTIKFTNNKGDSTTAIRTSDTAHYRCYANSNASFEVLKEETNIKQILVTCTSADYAKALSNSVQAETATTSTDGTEVTIIPSNAAATFAIAKFSAQTRITKIVITLASAISEDVYTKSFSLSSAEKTIPLGVSETITANIDLEATIRTIDWSSNNDNVTVDNGKITVLSSATVGETATITAKIKASAEENDYLSDSCIVTVGERELTKLSRSGYVTYHVGQKFSDYQNGSLTATWSDGQETTISISDNNLIILVGGEEFNKETVLTKEHNGKDIQFQYTDPNYTSIECKTNKTTLSVSEYFAINSLVSHFDNDNDFILSTSDSGSNYVEFSYISWGGKAAFTVTSSNEEIATATLDEENHTFSNREGTGKINLATVNGSKGQAEIILTGVVNEVSYSTTYVLTVRNTAPEVIPGETSYVKVSSLAEVTTGNYIITAFAGGNYYAMSNTFAAKIDGSVISVSENKISTTDLSSFALSLNRNSDTVSISNGSNYLKYSSSTNFKYDTTEVFHTISEVGDSGTFCITLNSSTRAILYRAGSYNIYGAYAASNLNNNNGEYFGLTLFKEISSGGTSDDTTIVQNFVTTYMQPNINVSNREDTDACRGENGYYAIALKHLSDDLNNAQRLIFRNDFSVYYERMVAWGAACQESFSINNNGEIVTNNYSLSSLLFVIQNNNNILPILVIISSITLISFGSIVIIKKRRATSSK